MLADGSALSGSRFPTALFSGELLAPEGVPGVALAIISCNALALSLDRYDLLNWLAFDALELAFFFFFVDLFFNQLSASAGNL